MSRETVLRALATALLALFFAATIVFAVLSHVNAPSAGGPILCRAIVHVDAVDTDSLSVLVTVIDTDADGFIRLRSISATQGKSLLTTCSVAVHQGFLNSKATSIWDGSGRLGTMTNFPSVPTIGNRSTPLTNAAHPKPKQPFSQYAEPLRHPLSGMVNRSHNSWHPPLAASYRFC